MWSRSTADGKKLRPTRHLLIGLGVGVLCWAQTLWDQFAGEGNLRAVLANRTAGEGVGWTVGAQVVASTVLLPPQFWLPGTMWQLTSLVDLASVPVAALALALWIALLATALLTATRRGHHALAVLAGIAMAALVAAVVAGARIPKSVFGIIPQNYFWMWSTGVFLTVGLAAGLSARSKILRRWFVSRSGIVVCCLAGIAMTAIASRPIDHFAAVVGAETAGQRIRGHSPIRWRCGFACTTSPDHSSSITHAASFDSYVRTVFLAELQRAGIGFVFEPGSGNIDRFGTGRC